MTLKGPFQPFYDSLITKLQACVLHHNFHSERNCRTYKKHFFLMNIFLLLEKETIQLSGTNKNLVSEALHKIHNFNWKSKQWIKYPRNLFQNYFN